MTRGSLCSILSGNFTATIVWKPGRFLVTKVIILNLGISKFNIECLYRHCMMCCLLKKTGGDAGWLVDH